MPIFLLLFLLFSVVFNMLEVQHAAVLREISHYVHSQQVVRPKLQPFLLALAQRHAVTYDEARAVFASFGLFK